jgi:hypothetical protein
MARGPLPQESQGIGSFREDLDLSHIVTQFERRAIPGGTKESPEDRMPVVEPEDLTKNPVAVPRGPLRASTSRVLASPRPSFAWDPNRYYRSLGVPWPYVGANRADLRLAFHEIEAANSRWLVHCMKQLLNPLIRAEYDALPLGERYLNDAYVQDELKRKAAEEASKRTAEGHYTTAREVLDEQGYTFTPDAKPDGEDGEETPEEVIDEDHLKRQDDSTVGGRWQYGFYVWGTYEWKLDLLEIWQEELLSEVAGRVPYLAVGLMGKKQRRDYAVADVDGTTVVFIRHDREVTPEITRSAVKALLKHESH